MTISGDDDDTRRGFLTSSALRCRTAFRTSDDRSFIAVKILPVDPYVAVADFDKTAALDPELQIPMRRDTWQIRLLFILVISTL